MDEHDRDRLRALEERIARRDERERSLTDAFVELKAQALAAVEEARTAKRMADGALHEFRSQTDATVRHVEKAVSAVQATNIEQTAMISKLGGHTQTLLDESRAARSRYQHRSELKLEQEAEKAQAMVADEHRRKRIAWALGILFVVAQTIQIARSMFWH